MVRLADLTPAARENIEALACPDFSQQPRPWVNKIPLTERKVALISSAGLMLRGDKTVGRGEAGYREIAHKVSANDVLMSHVSVNFDRTGYQQDLNVVLPRDRLDELVTDGVIGGVAETHYAFMGATDPTHMEPHARQLAQQLQGDGVDTVVLLPV